MQITTGRSAQSGAILNPVHGRNILGGWRESTMETYSDLTLANSTALLYTLPYTLLRLSPIKKPFLSHVALTTLEVHSDNSLSCDLGESPGRDADRRTPDQKMPVAATSPRISDRGRRNWQSGRKQAGALPAAP